MNDTLQSMIPFIFSGACFTFIQFLIQRHDIKSDKYKELNDKIEDGLEQREEIGRKRYEEHAEAIEELRRVMTELAKTTMEQQKIISANSNLLKGLAQDKLFYLTDKYIGRGCITLDELAVLEDIYEPYSSNEIKGNGRGKSGVEKCRQLPIVSEEIAIMKDKEAMRL